jgi:hypothetical protein
MHEFTITPTVGVGPVVFGMTRDDVHQLLGEPVWSHNHREQFFDGFFVDFDSGGAVEFIELATSEQFKVNFHGIMLLELEAEQALASMLVYGRYDETDPSLGYSYIFPDLQMSLWRPVLPESDEADDQDADDQDADDQDGRYFQALGVGRKGYFAER